MVAYSFKQQFVAPILSRAKCQTIRADRKRHARIGEELQLYTGMRTKACRLIGRAICCSVAPIRINLSGMIVIPDHVFILGAELDGFAALDGFDDWSAMREFWRESPSDRYFFGGPDWMGRTYPEHHPRRWPLRRDRPMTPALPSLWTLAEVAAHFRVMPCPWLVGMPGFCRGLEGKWLNR